MSASRPLLPQQRRESGHSGTSHLCQNRRRRARANDLALRMDAGLVPSIYGARQRGRFISRVTLSAEHALRRVDKKLRERAERAVFQSDDDDWHLRNRQFDRQCFERRVLRTKPYHRSGQHAESVPFSQQYVERGLHTSGIKLIGIGDVVDDEVLSKMNEVFARHRHHAAIFGSPRIREEQGVC